jgi:hypothetical protein
VYHRSAKCFIIPLSELKAHVLKMRGSLGPLLVDFTSTQTARIVSSPLFTKVISDADGSGFKAPGSRPSKKRQAAAAL